MTDTTLTSALGMTANIAAHAALRVPVESDRPRRFALVRDRING
jgi:hypothetical protein